MILIYFILLAYLFFIIWLLDGYRYSIKKHDNEEIKKPYVSVVVAARNESKNISKLIQCLNTQNYPKNKYEIIIINDRSTDTTKSILNTYSDKIKNFSFIDISNTPKEWSNKKWAIYNGIKKAKGDIIIQTDADCYMSNKWISSMVNPFKNIEIGFVSSLTPLINSSSNLFKHIFLMDSIAQDIFSGYAISKGLTISCSARSIAYRRNDFIKIKGYNDIYSIKSGDDDLILHKIIHYIGCKAKFIINPNAIVFSETPQNVSEFIHQRLRYASKGLLYYQKEFISKELRILLPFLYILNFLSTILILKFCYTGYPIYFFALLIKIIPEYFMIYPIYDILKIKWSWINFLILSIIHPFYIVLFGFLGPIYTFKWK